MRAPTHLCHGLVLLMTALLLLAAPAYGDDVSPLERLTPEERQVLEARVPGWGEMGKDQQARIAKNVIRLRHLSPEDREKLRRRVGALETHRERHGRMPEGIRGWRKRPGMREEFRRKGRLVRAVGLQMWSELPKPIRASVRAHLGARGRGAVEHAFFQRLWGLHAKKLSQGEIPPIAMPEDAPDQIKQRLQQMRKDADAGDERSRMRLAHFALAQRTRVIAERLEQVRIEDESALKAALEMVGKQIREEDPVLFEQALADLGTASQDKGALERYVRHGGPRGKGKRGRHPSLERLRSALKDAWPVIEKDPQLLEAATRLRQALERHGPGPSRGWMRRGGPRRGPQRGPQRGPERGPERGPR